MNQIQTNTKRMPNTCKVQTIDISDVTNSYAGSSNFTIPGKQRNKGHTDRHSMHTFMRYRPMLLWIYLKQEWQFMFKWIEMQNTVFIKPNRQLHPVILTAHRHVSLQFKFARTPPRKRPSLTLGLRFRHNCSPIRAFKQT